MAKKINKGTGRVEHDVLKRKLGTFSDNRKSENLSPIAKETPFIFSGSRPSIEKLSVNSSASTATSSPSNKTGSPSAMITPT